MSNKRFGCLVATLVLLLFFSLLANIVLMVACGGRAAAVTGEPRRFYEITLLPGDESTRAKIAVVKLQGIISTSISGALGDSMVDDIQIALRQALNDDKAKAIVLHIDSPGGEVTASDALYHAVLKAREKKPVVVYMSSVAASGGYYVACGGTYLMANETTITGSIGVIIQTLNVRELLNKIGIDAVVFKSGKFKDILSGTREMLPEEREYIQGLVMQIYDRFVDIVARERTIPAPQLRAGIADGRIVSGKDALSFKLLNAVGQIEDAYQKARELGKAPGAAVVTYEAPFRLSRLFRLWGKSTGQIDINLPRDIFPQLESGKMYLLPSYYVP
jgi:protease IV